MKSKCSALAISIRFALLVAVVALLSDGPALGQTARIVDIATDTWDPNNLADTEPSIAVNPTNPMEIAVVSFSGNWGAGVSAPVWKSNDGGATWAKVNQIPQSGTGTGPGDQKVAFDSAGNLFVAELAVQADSSANDYVYRQTGGADAALTAGVAYGDDQPHLDVDRSATGTCLNRLYSPWLNFSVAPVHSSVSNSTNGGAAMTNVGAGSNTFPNRTTRIALAPGGRAYIIYKTREGQVSSTSPFENAHFRVNRSDDCGATWTGVGGAAGVSVHGAAAVQTWFTDNFGNPAKGKVNRARSSDAWIAVDPNSGDIYAAHVSRDTSGFGQIYVVRSTTQGATWTSTRVTDGTHHSAYPEIAVAGNGTVGVLYIDYDDAGASTIFRHRFARSFDHGATWTDQILQNLDPGPLANATSGFLWGDYEGLTALGNTFYGVFTGQSIGRTTRQLDPIFFSQTAVRNKFWLPYDICAFKPDLCAHPRLNRNLISFECATLPCLVIDPLPRNCAEKWECRGCLPGGLCPPWYHIFVELDPRVFTVTLFTQKGEEVEHVVRPVSKGVVVSFRPSEEHFKQGSIGDYVLAFESDKVKKGQEFRFRTLLDVNNSPTSDRFGK